MKKSCVVLSILCVSISTYAMKKDADEKFINSLMKDQQGNPATFARLHNNVGSKEEKDRTLRFGLAEQLEIEREYRKEGAELRPAKNDDTLVLWATAVGTGAVILFIYGALFG